MSGLSLLTYGPSPALAQSGELGDVILLDDVPGFVDQQNADTVIACRSDGTCVTGEGNVLAGFRPAVWPNLRVVDDDPVIEANVQVEGTAFGRILARDGLIAERFASGPGQEVEWAAPEGTPQPALAVAVPRNNAWASDNFLDSDAVWISYAATGQGQSSPVNGTLMVVREQFVVRDTETVDLDGFVLADDTARVVLIQDEAATTLYDFNLAQATCAAGVIGCEPGEQGVLDATLSTPGDYTLEITARQVGGGPFGLQYAFELVRQPTTVADFCWTFDGGAPGTKVCASIAECVGEGACEPLNTCGPGGAMPITSGAPGEAICGNLAQQFFDSGVTDTVEDFLFVVGLDVPATSSPGSARLVTCTVAGTPYVPVCRDPAAKIVEATVQNDIPLIAVETPRCVKLGGRTYC